MRYLEKDDVHSKNIQIIYFTHLRKEKWKYIVIPQIQDLVDCGILLEANLVVALSGDEELIREAEIKIRDIVKSQLSYVKFTYNHENLYEYPGITALYDNALLYPEKIFIYFHSKGMWFGGDEPKRTILEKKLMENVITNNWKEIINIFNTRSDVSKVCFGSSNGGWCWFNFYWVRGKYIANCNKPEIRPNRYYYEGYLGHQYKGFYHYNHSFDAYEYNLAKGLPNTTYLGTYNIALNNTIPFFSPSDITDVLVKI